MKNSHNVDVHYVEKNIKRILRDLNKTPADELARSLARLSNTVDESVIRTEFNQSKT